MMKNLVLAIFLVLNSPAAMAGNTPTFDFTRSGRIGSIRLEARETGTAKNVARNLETDYGTYDRGHSRSKTISTKATNLGRATVTAHIYVFAFAQSLAGSDITLFEFDEDSASIKPTQTHEFKYEMTPLKSSTLNLAALGVSGGKVAGWLAVVTDESAPGIVLSHFASSPTIEALARKELTAMVAKLAAEPIK